MAASSAQPLHGERNVREVGDRAMAILEVKRVEELFGSLRADLASATRFIDSDEREYLAIA
jgi:hypothetical protein